MIMFLWVFCVVGMVKKCIRMCGSLVVFSISVRYSEIRLRGFLYFRFGFRKVVLFLLVVVLSRLLNEKLKWVRMSMFIMMVVNISSIVLMICIYVVVSILLIIMYMIINRLMSGIVSVGLSSLFESSEMSDLVLIICVIM